MATKLSNATPKEREESEKIRDAVLAEIGREGWSPGDVAGRLGLPPTIAEALISEHEPWTLELAVRIASALGVAWKVDLSGGEN